MVDRSVVARLYLEGSSGIEVAAKVGLTYGRVYQILRKLGIQTRPPQKAAPRAASRSPRVVDKLLAFLQAHPRSSVEDIAAGIAHPNRATVGQLLSRLKSEGRVSSETGNSFGYLWSLTAAS